MKEAMTRRKFMVGFGALLFAIAAPAAICEEDESKKAERQQKKSERRTKKRNKKLKRRGDDWLEPGDGKGWGDEYGD